MTGRETVRGSAGFFLLPAGPGGAEGAGAFEKTITLERVSKADETERGVEIRGSRTRGVVERATE